MSAQSTQLPRPRGRLPVLGDALSLRRDPLVFLESMRGLGDLVELRIGLRRVFLPTTAELTNEVLVTQARHFHKGEQYEKLRPLIGNGLASSEGKAHRRQRALVRPAFGQSRLAGYLTIVKDATEARGESWRDGQTLQVDQEMYQLAASIATRILYHNPIDTTTAAAIDQSGLTVVRGIGKRVIAPFGVLELLPTPENLSYRRAISRLHQIVDQIIVSRRDHDADHGDLLSMLLQATDPETGESLTDQQVHDEVTTMLGGATESTAVTLAWALYEIACHPWAEDKVLRELDSVDDLTADRLPYLCRVVNETLRLEGPAWMLTRRAISDVDLGGYLIPAGTSVWYSPYLLHRDPAIYPNPEQFNPDRWLELNDRSQEHCLYLPFGAGLRACVGENLARAELVVVLATLLRRWRFRLRPGTEVRKIAGFVLSPNRLPMIVSRRHYS